MTLGRVRELIREAGLQHITDALEELLLEAVRLVPQEIDIEQLELGASRIGGIPDLPVGTVWPEWEGIPLSFIAQIRVSDLRRIQKIEMLEAKEEKGQLSLFEVEPQSLLPREVASIVHSKLPNTGILYFFCFDDGGHKRYDWVKTADAWRVIFHNGEDTDCLYRVSSPNTESTEQFFLDPCTISFWREWTLPGHDHYDIQQLSLTPTEQEDYRCLLYDLEEVQGFSAYPSHRFLGHPFQIQNNMQIDCQLLSIGHYIAQTGYIGAGMATLSDELAARDWELLLQVENGWGGCLYFWLPSFAMRKQDFSQAWVVLQYD